MRRIVSDRQFVSARLVFSVEPGDLAAKTLERAKYRKGNMKALVLSIAVIFIPLTTSIHAETPLVDPTLPSVKPEALKALSDDRVRQQIMLESQAQYRGRCVCSYQTKDSNGRLCKGRHEVIRAGPQPICYPAQITSEMVINWRQSHP
jgi:hypothetical protein